jgi:cytochrome c biogenesis protein CcmG, thiol:disulfide interchange protein DsbE
MAADKQAPEAVGDAAQRRGRGVWWFLQAGALALVAGLLALLIWRVVGNDRGGAKVVAAVKAGKKPPAPSFDLPVIWDHAENWPASLRPALRDGRLALEELRGYPVVINFWASWCGPCRDEAPRFEASARAHRGRIVFLGVDAQDLTSDARAFAKKYGINYVSVRDGPGSILGRYGLTGFPETYFVNGAGRIVAHNAGEVSRLELERGIARASKT